MKRGNTSDRSDASPKRGREMEMNPPSTSSTSATDANTFLDLNDDCLYKVYEHLDLASLFSVGDTCIRLRRTAQDHFGRSIKVFKVAAHMKLAYPYSRLREVPVEQVFLKVSHVLRVFGAFITGFDETNMIFEEKDKIWDANWKFVSLPEWQNIKISKYRRKIVELLAKYCNNGNLTELRFTQANLTEEDEVRLRPVLKGLQTFHLVGCQCSAELLQMLPMWCPKLRELDITGPRFNTRLDGLRQRFQKLTNASFAMVRLSCIDVEHFLKCNPQLEEFRLRDCPGQDPRVFEIIGRYATEVETLHISLPRVETRNILLPRNRYPQNARYFDRLRNLKSVTLHDEDNNGNYMVRAIHDIVTAEIPLKMLSVGGEVYPIESLYENIAKLKTLKTLSWRLRGASKFNRVINICSNLTELSSLDLSCVDANVTAENLLELVRTVGKLQWLSVMPLFYVPRKLDIDAHTIKSIIELVEERAEKFRLKIELSENVYRLDFPEELAAAHKGSLTIVLKDPRTHNEMLSF